MDCQWPQQDLDKGLRAVNEGYATKRGARLGACVLPHFSGLCFCGHRSYFSGLLVPNRVTRAYDPRNTVLRHLACRKCDALFLFGATFDHMEGSVRIYRFEQLAYDPGPTLVKYRE